MVSLKSAQVILNIIDSTTYVQKFILMRFNASYELKAQSQCYFHIYSYLTELSVFWNGDILGKRTFCDDYHKEHASH